MELTLAASAVLKYFVICCLVFNVLSGQTDSPATQLQQTELMFSKAAEKKGIRDSFLEYFDDECVVFAPRPTNGKLAYSADSDSQSSLIWAPTVVQLSSSGDFGYTTGPSESREGKSLSDTAHYGHFVSVWKKNRDGQWKVILDIGIGYPHNEKREEALRVGQFPSNKKSMKSQAGMRYADWRQADSAYSTLCQSNGNSAALETFGSEEIRLYRKGKFPVEGREACKQLVKDETFSGFSFTSGQVSSAGDLGYTYGLAVTATADTSNYIRVWRKYDEWKLVIDIVKPWGRRK